MYTLKDYFQHFLLNFNENSYETGHSAFTWVNTQNIFKEVRAVLKKMCNGGTYLKDCKGLSPYLYSKEGRGRYLYLSWCEYRPTSQWESCIHTYLDVLVTPTSSCSTLPFNSFSNYQCKSNNKQGDTLHTHSVPKGFIALRKLLLHEPESAFLIVDTTTPKIGLASLRVFYCLIVGKKFCNQALCLSLIRLFKCLNTPLR